MSEAEEPHTMICETEDCPKTAVKKWGLCGECKAQEVGLLDKDE